MARFPVNVKLKIIDVSQSPPFFVAKMLVEHFQTQTCHYFPVKTFLQKKLDGLFRRFSEQNFVRFLLSIFNIKCDRLFQTFLCTIFFRFFKTFFSKKGDHTIFADSIFYTHDFSRHYFLDTRFFQTLFFEQAIFLDIIFWTRDFSGHYFLDTPFS